MARHIIVVIHSARGIHRLLRPVVTLCGIEVRGARGRYDEARGPECELCARAELVLQRPNRASENAMEATCGGKHGGDMHTAECGR